MRYVNTTNPKEKWIYFIGPEGENAVKIGKADFLEQRLSDLQIANHRRLIVYAAIECPVCVEGWLHKYLADHLIRGEWFRIEGKVERVIDAALLGGPDAVYQVMELPKYAVSALKEFFPRSYKLSDWPPSHGSAIVL